MQKDRTRKQALGEQQGVYTGFKLKMKSGKVQQQQHENTSSQTE